MSNMTSKPAEQVGGTHYSRLSIEPIQFIEANGLGYSEGNVVKYISRWKNKNGLEDLNKAKWYVDKKMATFDGEKRVVLNYAPDFAEDEKKCLVVKKRNACVGCGATTGCS